MFDVALLIFQISLEDPLLILFHCHLFYPSSVGVPKVAPSCTPADPVKIVIDLPRLLLLIPLLSISVAPACSTSAVVGAGVTATGAGGWQE
jgi:hypothetical protein